MREFDSIKELHSLIGQDVADSDWVLIDQARINTFADATGDHQWIHVDPERAARGPFGTPIAHGFLTLSLLPLLTQQAFLIRNTQLGVNYGVNKVRFPAPVPVGSRIMGRFKLLSIDDIDPVMGVPGAQLVWQATMIREGFDKPVCVAETVVRRYGS
jgi:acyl dehydratase